MKLMDRLSPNTLLYEVKNLRDKTQSEQSTTDKGWQIQESCWISQEFPWDARTPTNSSEQG